MIAPEFNVCIYVFIVKWTTSSRGEFPAVTWSAIGNRVQEKLSAFNLLKMMMFLKYKWLAEDGIYLRVASGKYSRRLVDGL